MDNAKVAEIKQKLAASYAELLELVRGPLAQLESELLYRPPVESEWSVMENLAHIIEFLPYWASEVEKLVANPGVSFGRTMEDEGRLSAIRDHGHDLLEQARTELPVSYERLVKTISGLQETDFEKTGVHRRAGEKNLEWFIQEFITGHLEGHLRQIRETLSGIK